MILTLMASEDIRSILLGLIPVAGTIITAIIGYLINKRMVIHNETNSKKRKIYEEFLNALTLTQFEGNLLLLIVPGDDYAYREVHATKLEVIKGYEKVKLWGSEGVINACYDFFTLQIKEYEKKTSVDQVDMKKSYYRIIEEMRKDLKVKNFSLNEKNIQIVSFDRNDKLDIS